MSKVKEFLNEVRIATNKEAIYEIIAVADDIEEITKELRFQANQGKRDPDKYAEEILNKVEAELFRLERLVKRAQKDLLHYK